MRRTLLLALLLIVTAASRATTQEAPVASPTVNAVVGTPSGSPLTGDTLDRTTREVASLLRCPVCQGSSVWDSPATMAVNMKHQVRDLLAEGYSQDQILRYFRNSYGDFVLLAPPVSGIGVIVWVLPALLLAAGGCIVWRLLSRERSDSGSRSGGSLARSRAN